jgi:hypothetical protein
VIWLFDVGPSADSQMNRMDVSKIAAKDASQIEALGEARDTGGVVPKRYWHCHVELPVMK